MEESKNVDHESRDHILNSRGLAALKRRGLYEELSWSVDTELHETILMWHIATHVYLIWCEWKHEGRPHHLAQVTQELSNYMMFLLALRPYMLPDNVSRQRYVELCHQVMYELDYSSEGDLLRLITEKGDLLKNLRNERMNRRGGVGDDTFGRACELSAKLISQELETQDANDMLELISQVWVELLCYAAYRCKSDSHARQLSNGGEFTTVAALLLEYTKYGVWQIT